MAFRPQILFIGCQLLWRKPHHVFLALRLSVWLMALSLLIKCCSLRRVLMIFTAQPRPTTNAVTPQQIAHVLDRLLSLDVFVFTPTCWKRAIILHRFLALQGIATRIIFGVRRDEEKNLDGHAWLEFQGEAFLEAQPPHYTPTYSFPA